jgi:hypothetical protein
MDFLLTTLIILLSCAYGQSAENCFAPLNYQCRNGDCIKIEYVCNGLVDCADKSDEDGDCSESLLLLNHNQKFISNLIFIDEKLCKEPDWYRCNDNITCIESVLICDKSTGKAIL